MIFREQTKEFKLVEDQAMIYQVGLDESPGERGNAKTVDQGWKTMIQSNGKAVAENEISASKISLKPNLSNLTDLKLNSKLGRFARKPELRKIQANGQLNHLKFAGSLWLISLLLALFVFINELSNASGSLWPFSGNYKISTPKFSLASNWPIKSFGHIKSERARNAGGLAQAAQANADSRLAHNSSNQNAPEPITKQYHYFWNHDQMEPKLFAEEASKILSEAQSQTNHVFANARGPSASKRQDFSASNKPQAIIPPSIQQQLTSMVLMMQKQQEMSMMMQPGFDQFQSQMVDPQRRSFSMIQQQPAPIIPPFGGNQFWVSGSSQHPVIASPPPSMYSSMASMQSPTVSNPMFMMNPIIRPQPMQTSAATMAGVPVFGPFMISPTISGQPFGSTFAHQIGRNSFNHNNNNNNQRSQTKLVTNSVAQDGSSKSVASALLGRRKSWPILGAFRDNTSFKPNAHSSLTSQASQLQPTIASPIMGPSQMRPVKDSGIVQDNSDALALLDAASNQLIEVLANQVQADAIGPITGPKAFTDQRSYFNQGDRMGSLASPRGRNITLVSQELDSTASQLMDLPTQIALDLAASLPMLANSFRSSDASQPSFFNQSRVNNQPPFGSRLGRRHLNGDEFERISSPDLNDHGRYSGAHGKVEDDRLNSIQVPKARMVTDSIERNRNLARENIESQMILVPRIMKKDSAREKVSKSAEIKQQLLLVVSTESPYVMSQSNSKGFHPKQLRRIRRSTDWKSIGPLRGSDDVLHAQKISSKSIFNQSLVKDSKILNDLEDESSWPDVAKKNSFRHRFELDRVSRLAHSDVDSFNSTLKKHPDLSDGDKGNMRPMNLNQANRIGNLPQFARQHIGSSTETINLTGPKAHDAAGAILQFTPTQKHEFNKPEFVSNSNSGSQVDPMSASVAESARVVNYFQNVDNQENESANSASTTTTSTTTSTTTTPAPPSAQQQFKNQAPEVNVGFSAPAKHQFTRNHVESYPGDTKRMQPQSMSRQQLAQSSTIKHFPTQQDQQASTGTLIPKTSLFTNYHATNTDQHKIQDYQNQQQDLKLHQLQVAANSADISSAATGTQQAYANVGANRKSSPSIQTEPMIDGGTYARNDFAHNSNSQQEKASSYSTLQGFYAKNYIDSSANKLAGKQSVVDYEERKFNEDRPSATPSETRSSYNEDVQTNQQYGSSIINHNNNNNNLNLDQQSQEFPIQQDQSGSNNYDSPTLAGGVGGEASRSQNQALAQSGQYNDLEVANDSKPSRPTAAEESLNSPMNLSTADLMNRLNLQAPNGNQNQPGEGFSDSAQPETAEGLNEQSELSQQHQQSHRQASQFSLGQNNKPFEYQQEYLSKQMQLLGAALNSLNQQKFEQHLREAATNSPELEQRVKQMNLQTSASSLLQETLRNNPLVLQQLQQSGLLFTPEDESAAAFTAAAAGIPSFSGSTQLLPMQNRPHSLNDISSLAMSGSEKREQQDDSNDGEGSKKSKHPNKNKSSGKKGYRQVSHHYHFNSFNSPFEDPDIASLAPLNALDIASSLKAQEAIRGAAVQKQASKQSSSEDEKEEDKEEENNKTKKKSFLRRFSLKKLFKRFKKDKTKEAKENGSSNQSDSEEK